jgi:membrane protein DedA with SNARE-associated domain
VAEWQSVTPLENEDGAPPRRRPDLGALIPGLMFIALAILLMSPVDLPEELFDGVLAWIVVIVAGVALLVSELRRARRRRR